MLDQLEQLYRRHGLFLTRQRSIALAPGARAIGDLLREQPPGQIAGSPVVLTDDLGRVIRQHADGDTEPLDLPCSDVLIYRLDNGARVIVRPSGTEPKLKCYYEVQEAVREDEDFAVARERAESAAQSLVEAHQESLAVLLSAV